MIVSSRGRRRADLLDVDEAPGRLDLRLDPDVADRQPRVALDLGQQQVEGDDLGGGLDLGQHDLVEPRARAADDLDHVLVGPRRVPGVDPHAQDAVVPVLLHDRLDDLGARGHLLVRGDGVFEVEERHVGRDRRRLGEELLRRARRREARTAGQVAGSLRHARRLPSVAAGSGRAAWRTSTRVEMSRVQRPSRTVRAVAACSRGRPGRTPSDPTQHRVTAATDVHAPVEVLWEPARVGSTVYGDWLESTTRGAAFGRRRRRARRRLRGAIADLGRLDGDDPLDAHRARARTEDGLPRRGGRGCSTGLGFSVDLAGHDASTELSITLWYTPRFGPVGSALDVLTRSNVTNDQKRSVRTLATLAELEAGRRAARTAAEPPRWPRVSPGAREERRRCGRT